MHCFAVIDASVSLYLDVSIHPVRKQYHQVSNRVLVITLLLCSIHYFINPMDLTSFTYH